MANSPIDPRKLAKPAETMNLLGQMLTQHFGPSTMGGEPANVAAAVPVSPDGVGNEAPAESSKAGSLWHMLQTLAHQPLPEAPEPNMPVAPVSPFLSNSFMAAHPKLGGLMTSVAGTLAAMPAAPLVSGAGSGISRAAQGILGGPAAVQQARYAQIAPQIQEMKQQAQLGLAHAQSQEALAQAEQAMGRGATAVQAMLTRGSIAAQERGQLVTYKDPSTGELMVGHPIVDPISMSVHYQPVTTLDDWKKISGGAVPGAPFQVLQYNLKNQQATGGANASEPMKDLLGIFGASPQGHMLAYEVAAESGTKAGFSPEEVSLGKKMESLFTGKAGVGLAKFFHPDHPRATARGGATGAPGKLTQKQHAWLTNGQEESSRAISNLRSTEGSPRNLQMLAIGIMKKAQASGKPLGYNDAYNQAVKQVNQKVNQFNRAQAAWKNGIISGKIDGDKMPLDTYLSQHGFADYTGGNPYPAH